MEIVIELPQDVDKLCRTCMNMVKMDDMKNGIFDEENKELLKMLKCIASVKISMTDGLPKYLCSECVKKLHLAYSFKQQCQETYINFRGFLNPHEDNPICNDAVDADYVCVVCLERFTSQYKLSRHEIQHYKEETLTSRYAYENAEKKEISVKSGYCEDVLSLINERKTEIPMAKIDEEEIDVGENVINNFEEVMIKDPPRDTENVNNVEVIETNEIKICDICNREFGNNLLLCLHFINHALITESDTDPDIFKQYFFCTCCGQTFETGAHLTSHITKCFSSYIEYKCDKCTATLNTEIDLLKHDRLEHENNFSWNDVFLKSIEKVTYVCPICAEQFVSKHDLTVHSVKHVLKQVTCRICKKTFCSQVAYNNHLKTHPNYKHICHLCGRCLGSRHALKTHMMGVHSSASNYTCTICSKKFKTPSRLYIHKLTHKKDKKYNCRICGYKTNNVGDFKVHNRIHTLERPYKCNFVNCNRQFKTSSHLNEHIQRHLQIKKFQCSQCDMVFGHNHSLKMHLMVHTGEKPFSCEICNSKFRRKHHLKNHMKQHEPVNSSNFIVVDNV